MSAKRRVVLGVFFNNIGLGVFLLSYNVELFDRSGGVNGFATFLIIEQLVLLVFGVMAGSLLRFCLASKIASLANFGFFLAAFVAASAPIMGLNEVVAGKLIPAVVGFIFAFSRAFFRPTIFSITRETVAENQIHSLNASQTIAIQSAQLLAALLAGVLLEVSGSTISLYVGSLAYLVSAVFYRSAVSLYAPQKDAYVSFFVLFKNLPRQWWEALGPVLRIRRLRFLAISVGVDFYSISAFLILSPLVVDRFFSGSGFWFGILQASFFGGAITGGIICHRIEMRVAVELQRLLGLTCQLVAWLWLVFVDFQFGLFFSFYVLGVGVALSSTSVISMLQQFFPIKNHGQVGVLRSCVIAVVLLAALPVLSFLINRSFLLANLLSFAFVAVVWFVALLHWTSSDGAHY